MRSLPFVLALAATPSLALAQIESDGTPCALTDNLRTELVPIEFVQPPDVGAYLAEDAARTEAGPLRYGALLEVSINPFDNGVWDELADGTQVWRFKVYSPGAKSIGLEFSEYWIPDGAQIYLYGDTLERVHGAYTSINNQPHDQIQFAPFPGDSVIFEYVQPAGVEGQARLELGTVIYDYRDLFALEAGLDATGGLVGGSGAGSCLIDVNCPEGDPYDLQKRATVRTLSGGGLCSGALINNTSQDGTRYVLTAWHCGQSSNTVFRFNYQTSGCGTGGAPTGQQVSGGTNLVNDQSADGRLMRINNNIPASYNAIFAGWSRSTQNPSFCMSMHHPSGGVKKISIDGNGATKATVPIGGIGNVLAWNCNFVGGVQGGSSGGPLFNQNGQVIGDLSGANLGVSCPQSTSYGRLYSFWANVNVAQYLDPTGTGLTSVNAFDPANPGGGPGGTVPQIDSIAPTTIAAVNPTSPVTITLTGDGFEGVTSVEVDGVPLSAFPPEFSVPSNSTIVVTLQPPYNVGTKTIKVIEGALSDEVVVPVTFNLTPTIDLVSSDPSFLISAFPLEVYMGSFPNDLAFLLVSTSLVPSTLPGIFSASIGNNLTNLFLVNNFVINPATGYAKSEIPISGLPTGTKLYFQAGVISAVLPSLPLSMSNVESGTVLF
ncbi:trypsin-like peptidase domain-containing protein [Engelhardtia mirabilis]|uniref:Protease 1 n=1 Tax=Engelhardtia mirabilis TaxID=2528011 RepID=A0A518BI77_9BACT|nr:Protease 1 precursor [Planctomycetes bacterium Pla133]QDV01002.1 Protease 1 precursor [Planctomycetes bacterium Pla86]